MSEVQTGTITTKVPARLDRLPWSRWHWMVIIGLGTVWILDGRIDAKSGSVRRHISGGDLIGCARGRNDR